MCIFAPKFFKIMSNHIRLSKGLNIPLKGSAKNQITKTVSSDIIAVKPTDFKLVNIKLLVKEGDTVKAGTPVLADKKRPEIVFCSPASGVVSEIIRGEKRKLLEVRIKTDKTNDFLAFDVPNIKTAKREEIIKSLIESGLWATIKQRPYGIVPNPDVEPKAIFISAFDSSPLAPDFDFALKAEFENIQTAVNALAKLTIGGVHLSFNPDNCSSSPFHRLENTIQHVFAGPHPAGNTGIQIHHINPINKGEVVWTVDMYALAAIGRLFNKGIYDVHKTIPVTGPRAVNPSYITCLPGMKISDIAEYIDNTGELDVRAISGNVLSGDNVGKDGFLGFYHNQITFISEGKYHEMFGWAKPFRTKKFSVSRSYFSWLMPKKEYSLDTNINGGERAFVVTGEYEKVLPMDIYPMFLLKAILAEDIDKMEALGIYEVAEEDLALCEFVCPSKTEIQDIVSKGIALMVKEMS